MVTQNLIAETGLWGYEQIGSETEVIDRAYRHFILVRFPIGEASMHARFSNWKTNQYEVTISSIYHLCFRTDLLITP